MPYYNNNSQLTIIDYIFNLAKTDPDKVIFKKQDYEFPFKWNEVSALRFSREVLLLGNWILGQNLKLSKNIGIMAPCCYEWALADKAIMAIGATSVGIDIQSSIDNLRKVTQDAELAGVVCFDDESSQLLGKIKFNGWVLPIRSVAFANILEKDSESCQKVISHFPNSEVLATIIYTSGTTGAPKGIPLYHYNIFDHHSFLDNEFLEPKFDDNSTIMWLPLCNGTGRIMLESNLVHGVVQYFISDPHDLFIAIRKINPTILVVMPRVLEKVHESIIKNFKEAPLFKKYFYKLCFALSESGGFARFLVSHFIFAKVNRALWGIRIRFIFCGSASISEDILQFFEILGIQILQVYGLSEISCLVTMNRPLKNIIGSVGMAFGDCNIRLSEDNEILVRSKFAIEHYWKDRNPLKDEDGYFHTGDIGYLQNGFLFLRGRKNDVVKTSTGVKVSLTELEKQYSNILGVERVIIIGRNRKYLTALIELTDCKMDPDMKVRIFNEILEKGKHLSEKTRVKGVHFLDRPLSVEAGELTTTFKLRRVHIEANFRNEIAVLYRDRPQ